jgi:oxepin-CoA hydrolase/3-oxo-5,6-dehydrosuberyl-CoA semialdehyde dehydrogenase
MNDCDSPNPMRRYFEDISVGDTYITHSRTITEADVANFAALTGDYYYLHVDAVAAAKSIFQERVAHGLLVLSIATGLTANKRPGPIMANYGVETLRFVRPVMFDDTIKAQVSCREKRDRKRLVQGRPARIVAGNSKSRIKTKN